MVENVTKAAETSENIIYYCNLEYKYSFSIKLPGRTDCLQN